MEKNLTSGSVLKNLVYFSLPYLLSYFLQTLYGMADLFIIGQFEGVAGTTAVSVGSQVMHMLTVMSVGLAMGATVSIGQAVGAKDRKKAADCTGNTVTVFLVLSVILTAVLLLSVRGIVSVMSTPEEAVELVGHAVGGVCPFAVKPGVKTCLDVSLQRFTTVFPACGSSNSAIELTCEELEKYSSNFVSWVDVAKGWRPEEKEA